MSDVAITEHLHLPHSHYEIKTGIIQIQPGRFFFNLVTRETPTSIRFQYFIPGSFIAFRVRFNFSVLKSSGTNTMRAQLSDPTLGTARIFGKD